MSVENWREKPKHSEKRTPVPLFPTVSSTWNSLGSKPGIRIERWWHL